MTSISRSVNPILTRPRERMGKRRRERQIASRNKVQVATRDLVTLLTLAKSCCIFTKASFERGRKAKSSTCLNRAKSNTAALAIPLQCTSKERDEFRTESPIRSRRPWDAQRSVGSYSSVLVPGPLVEFAARKKMSSSERRKRRGEARRLKNPN